MNENISAYVDYNRAFTLIKKLYENSILDLEVCNEVLRGIANDLGLKNPIIM